MKWKSQVAILSIVALLIVPTMAPEVLAFPYATRSGDHMVYSETPIDQAALDRVTRRSAALVQASPIARSSEPRKVFLTQGGWRWKWLAFRNQGAFAISRPMREIIVMNRSHVLRDKVLNGKIVGGQRSMSGTLAHETCHGVLRRSFGIEVEWSKPQWLREGYCDHVAQHSSLTEAEVAKLKAAGQSHPAIPYFEGRRKVAAELARNGGDVDALFAGAR